jgi:hypothetical protein
MVNLPGLCGEIITQLLCDAGDIDVVGSVSDVELLPAVGNELQPEVVLVGLDQAGFPSSCAAWFDSRPDVRMIAIAPDGRHLSELRAPSGGVSPEGLVRAILGSARSE